VLQGRLLRPKYARQQEKNAAPKSNPKDSTSEKKGKKNIALKKRKNHTRDQRERRRDQENLEMLDETTIRKKRQEETRSGLGLGTKGGNDRTSWRQE